MTTAAPFLMFTGQCEEALTFYAQTLPDTRILSLDKKPDGTVAMARLSVARTTKQRSSPYRTGPGTANSVVAIGWGVSGAGSASEYGSGAGASARGTSNT